MPRSDRPPPTSYRDAAEAFHPGHDRPIAQLPPAPTFLPGPGEGALVATPRSLPARWLRYATPASLIGGAIGIAVTYLLPVSVGVVLIVLMLAGIAAIRKYVPDAVPAARARR
jgi:hypothetical protein